MWSRIKILLGKNKKPDFNINHPELRDKVEEVFKCGGRTYYRFKEEYDMPTGRYKWVMHHLREVDLRMDMETAKAYIKELKRCLNAEKNKIDLETAWKIIFSMESRFNLAFEPEGVYRLASVVYFDSSEDLSRYDIKYNREKVELWKRHEFIDFFLTSPIKDLLRLSGISQESLQEYIRTSQEILKDLTLEPLNQSQENL